MTKKITKKISVALLLLLILALVEVVPSWARNHCQIRNPFPHQFTPLVLKKWERFQGEGLSLKQQLLNAIPYFKKELTIRKRAPIEEVQYFKDQTKILQKFSISATEQTKMTRLGFVGDLMWIRNQWDTFLDPAVRDYIQKFDVFLGNLETPISKSNPVKGKMPDYASYNAEPGLIDSFSVNGRTPFTALALANNHVLDKEELGAMETQEFLNSRGILHSGVRLDPKERTWVTFERNGMKFGFYAATWGINQIDKKDTTSLKIEYLDGIAPENEDPVQIKKIAAVMKEMESEKVDFKIVMLHWGHEYELYPTPKIVKMGHEVAKTGADLIIGSHPHVQQPAELCFFNGYEDKLKSELKDEIMNKGCILKDKSSSPSPRKSMIVYSMGNFTTALFTFYCQLGLIREIQVYPDPSLGHPDFKIGTSKLVYNDHAVFRPRSPRRLLFWDDYENPSSSQIEKVKVIKDLIGMQE